MILPGQNQFKSEVGSRNAEVGKIGDKCAILEMDGFRVEDVSHKVSAQGVRRTVIGVKCTTKDIAYKVKGLSLAFTLYLLPADFYSKIKNQKFRLRLD